MRYKVSEIAELLTKKLGGNPVIKAEMLNKLLIQSGDLVETRIGKVETKTGERHGIIGQYADDFWVPYYDENAVEYVIELAAEKLGLTFPTAAIQEINGPNMYVYSRTMYNILKKTYQTPYVFLESEKDVWWTYNEAASHTAALLNYSASHNKAGQPLLPYISEEKLREACKKLENAGCSYVIFGPGKSIYSQARQTKTKGHLQVTSVSTEPVVQRYSVVTLLWY
ncbi:MAG: hypothetical protein IKC04_01420, partial [Oscillospiraceae bacterium]|nr:hypothetical protein [Oscillospiraceae bacterium]